MAAVELLSSHSTFAMLGTCRVSSYYLAASRLSRGGRESLQGLGHGSMEPHGVRAADNDKGEVERDVASWRGLLGAKDGVCRLASGGILH